MRCLISESWVVFFFCLTERRPGRLSVGDLLAVLQRQQGLQPRFRFLVGIEHDTETVVLGVEGDHVFVLRVRTLVYVEARPQGDAAFRRLTGVELLLGVVVLESGRSIACLVAKHEELPPRRLQLLQVSAAYYGAAAAAAAAAATAVIAALHRHLSLSR